MFYDNNLMVRTQRVLAERFFSVLALELQKGAMGEDGTVDSCKRVSA